MKTDIEECLKILPRLLDFANLPDAYISMILNEISQAYNDNLTDIKLTSNLYWLFHTPKEGDRVVKGKKGGGIYGTVFKDDDGQLSINLDEPLKTSKEKIFKLRGGYNKIVEDALLLNWNYISSNSLQYIYNNMKLAEYEELSRSKPVYFVYHGNSPCKWCKKHKGTIVRLLPREIIENDIDELSHYGIDDIHAKTVIWFNKNNINHSKLRVCAFPHTEEEHTCGIDLLPINLEAIEEVHEKKKGNFDFSTKIRNLLKKKRFKFGSGEPMTPEQWEIFDKSIDARWKKEVERITGVTATKGDRPQFETRKKPYRNNNTKEWYNPETGQVEKTQIKRKFIPQEIDYSYQSKEEKEYRKPTFIESDKVRYNNNIYERVAPGDYEKRKAVWDRDRTLPIPVSTDSTRYEKIFGATKNKKKEKDNRKPTFIGESLVRFNNNIYEAVPASEYNRKLEEWRKDPTKPAPVNESGPGYKRIFEEAGKNRNKE